MEVQPVQSIPVKIPIVRGKILIRWDLAFCIFLYILHLLSIGILLLIWQLRLIIMALCVQLKLVLLLFLALAWAENPKSHLICSSPLLRVPNKFWNKEDCLCQSLWWVPALVCITIYVDWIFLRLVQYQMLYKLSNTFQIIMIIENWINIQCILHNTNAS